MADAPSTSTNWSEVAAKAQAVLCLHQAGLDDRPILERAKFLMALGLTRADAAALLGSTDDSLRVGFARAAKKAAK